MQSHEKRFLECLSAASGSTVSWLAAHGHDAVAAFAFYGGAVVVLLSGISYSLDLWRKWKQRNDKD